MTTSVKQEYRKRNPAGHWFDASTMRFFSTRIFVTSEEPPYGPRKAHVRVMDPEGSVSTVGPFNEWSTSLALRVARDLFTQGSSRVQGKRFYIWETEGGTA